METFKTTAEDYKLCLVYNNLLVNKNEIMGDENFLEEGYIFEELMHYAFLESMCLYNGTGVRKNRKKAIYYLKCIADFSDEAAKELNILGIEWERLEEDEEDSSVEYDYEADLFYQTTNKYFNHIKIELCTKQYWH